MGTPTAAAPPDTSRRDYVFSYLTLRLTIGIVALNLPVLVLALTIVDDGIVLPSISDAFYHSFAVSVFVGAMCAFAAFLWAYRFSWWESVFGNVGAVAGAAVAIFPTSPSVGTTDRPAWVPVVHYAAAAVFFVVLGIFCVIWWRGSSAARDDGERTGHPVVYAVSGAGILLVAVVAVLSKAVLPDGVASLRVFLICEILMVELFGLSWVHRGGAGGLRSAGVAALATLASLLLIFVVPTTSPGAAVLVLVVAVVVVLALLWDARPTASGNRYASDVRGTVP
jgi:hypothetical protein